MSVVSMGKLLYEVKGGGQGQAMSKSEITAAADAILQPLMDLLDGKNIVFLLKAIFYRMRKLNSFSDIFKRTYLKPDCPLLFYFY